MTNRSGRRRKQAGFTLMELMVVLAIIAMIAVFALPKITKVTGKAKMTDAINSLSNLGSQTEAFCATKNALPTSTEFSTMYASIPNGYAKLELKTGGGCSSFTLKADTSDAELPDICIQRQTTGAFLYKMTYPSGSSLTDADAPLPSAQIGSFTCS